jgi:hypothetical protein
MKTEDDFRLANLVTPYGLGTRSYNRSAEKREMERQRKEATEKYQQGPKQEIIIGPICSCRSFNFPHELKRHKELNSPGDWSLESERRWKPIWEELG